MPQDIDFKLPFPARSNPDASRAEVYTLAWVRRHGLGDDATCQAISNMKLSEVAGLLIPDARAGDMDLTSDVMTFTALWDDQFTGAAGSSPSKAMEMCQEIQQHILPPAGTTSCASPFAQAWTDIMERMATGMSGYWYDRAVRHWHDWFGGVFFEVFNRPQTHAVDLESYLGVRRITISIATWLDLVERVGRFEIPHQARDTMALEVMRTIAADVCLMVNDVFSVELEEFNGEASNSVLVLERTRGLDRAAAVTEVCRLVSDRVSYFQELEKELPRLVESLRLDSCQRDNLARYVEGMRGLMAGNLAWHHVTPRYQIGKTPKLPDYFAFLDNLATTERRTGFRT